MQNLKQHPFFFWTNGICASVFALLLGLAGTFFVPAFRDVHIYFPREQMNAFTRLFESYPQLLWCAVIPCLAIWLFCTFNFTHPHARRQGSIAFAALAMIEFMILILLIWSMYAPAIQIREHTVGSHGIKTLITRPV
ncbi:hypothetical protein [Undibacterium sp. Tian12W]|uniref:hypothetical protein n=1 Tax=Undibacterium sp. Tian12W TaxID=3413054 RepID=UPI003BF1F047